MSESQQDLAATVKKLQEQYNELLGRMAAPPSPVPSEKPSGEYRRMFDEPLVDRSLMLITDEARVPDEFFAIKSKTVALANFDSRSQELFNLDVEDSILTWIMMTPAAKFTWVMQFVAEQIASFARTKGTRAKAGFERLAQVEEMRITGGGEAGGEKRGGGRLGGLLSWIGGRRGGE
jgi:hypothetical protein